MAKVQGFPGFRYAVVHHPVANLDDAEIRERAQEALPQVLEILLGTSGGH